MRHWASKPWPLVLERKTNLQYAVSLLEVKLEDNSGVA